MDFLTERNVDLYAELKPLTDLIGWQVPKARAGVSKTFRELFDTWIAYFEPVDGDSVLIWIVEQIQVDQEFADLIAIIEDPSFESLAVSIITSEGFTSVRRLN